MNLPCCCPTSHLPCGPLTVPLPPTIPADSLPADTTKTVTTIRNSGSRLLNLINDILDAAALRKVSAAPGVGGCVVRRAAGRAHVRASRGRHRHRAVLSRTLLILEMHVDTSDLIVSKAPAPVVAPSALFAPQGKLAVQQGKVNLKNVADDVIDLTGVQEQLR